METSQEDFEVLNPLKRETVFETIAVEAHIDPETSLERVSTQPVPVEKAREDPMPVSRARQESAPNLEAPQLNRSGSLIRQDSASRKLQQIATFMETNVISDPKTGAGDKKELAVSPSCCAIL